MQSRTTFAAEVQHWVCSEVLPSIRKTGQYTVYSDDAGNPLDIPEVVVELVRTIPAADALYFAPRLTVREYLDERSIAGIRHQQAVAIGKICRRHMLNNDLEIKKVWQPYAKGEVKAGGFGVYPERILELAWDEFQKGLRD